MPRLSQAPCCSSMFIHLSIKTLPETHATGAIAQLPLAVLPLSGKAESLDAPLGRRLKSLAPGRALFCGASRTHPFCMPHCRTGAALVSSRRLANATIRMIITSEDYRTLPSEACCVVDRESTSNPPKASAVRQLQCSQSSASTNSWREAGLSAQ